MASAAQPFLAGHPLRPLLRPARRSLPRHGWQRAPWAVIAVFFVCFVSHALATAADGGRPVVLDPRAPSGQGRGWLRLSEQDVQRRRVPKRAESQSAESSTATSASGSVTTTFSIAIGTLQPSSTSTVASASPLPSILDSLSSDFSPGPNGESPPCPVFIHSFLADPAFKQCYPLSLLFDKSVSFFEAQKSPVGITRTLDATCAANAASCNAYMARLAQNFTRTENCGLDYQRGSPVVVDAYTAMVAYAPVYAAGCLKDPQTGAYCYANAVTNTTNASNTYVYFLPLNQTLPGATVPGCSECTRQTMALYQAATADRRQPIAATYAAAAKQVNTFCGPGFANETLAAAVVSAGAVSGQRALPAAVAWLCTALALWVAVLCQLA